MRAGKSTRIFASTAWTVMVLLATCTVTLSAAEKTMKISVVIELGPDLGQSFGTLFEGTDNDGTLVVGAGFQNVYNTYYRGSRHTVQFFLRPTQDNRGCTGTKLPRPNHLCGTYLDDREGVVCSTYGGVKAWNPITETWQKTTGDTGAEETMRVGNRTLAFAGGRVLLDGKVVLEAPAKGSYQRFFYANGHLCFYHVNRGPQGYRPYKNDEDGFSKLYACPWVPGSGRVDLSKAAVLTLPVVGETTFAWGQLGRQILTGSNIGGFYVFENGNWRMLLEPDIKVSYQLYSTLIYYDRLLMGQYPTGRLFAYDGKKITELTGWPPGLDGVSKSAREAQTTIIYGGDVFVGVWPWGELWRYNPDSDTWTFMRRMFEHPPLSAAVTHPYDAENRANSVRNQWGQRITSLVPSGADLFVATSAKSPCKWEPKAFPFLAPDKWKAYGTVYRLTMPGHLGAAIHWKEGPTRLDFMFNDREMRIRQDGEELARAPLSGTLVETVGAMTGLEKIAWKTGIYGPFNGRTIKGSVNDGP